MSKAARSCRPHTSSLPLSFACCFFALRLLFIFWTGVGVIRTPSTPLFHPPTHPSSSFLHSPCPRNSLHGWVRQCVLSLFVWPQLSLTRCHTSLDPQRLRCSTSSNSDRLELCTDSTHHHLRWIPLIIIVCEQTQRIRSLALNTLLFKTLVNHPSTWPLPFRSMF